MNWRLLYAGTLSRMFQLRYTQPDAWAGAVVDAMLDEVDGFTGWDRVLTVCEQCPGFTGSLTRQELTRAQVLALRDRHPEWWISTDDWPAKGWGTPEERFSWEYLGSVVHVIRLAAFHFCGFKIDPVVGKHFVRSRMVTDPIRLYGESEAVYGGLANLRLLDRGEFPQPD